MKQLFNLIIAILVTAIVSAQGSKTDFIGTWVANKNTNTEATTFDNSLKIGKSSSSWTIFSNQLNEGFDNKQVGDTLLLIYNASGEVGSSFARLYKGSVPKKGKVSAKCSLESPKELGVVYLNKKYIKDIRTFFAGTPEENKLIYPSTLYFFKKN